MSNGKSVVKESQGQDFTPVESGVHPGVCAEYIYLGEVDTKFGKKEKGKFVFQVEEEDEQGQRKEVRTSFTLSLGTSSKPSNLRKLLEGWRGKAFTSDEIAEGIDLNKVVGAPCMLVVTQKKSEASGRMYAELQSIAPVGKGGKKLKVENYTPENEREWAKKKATEKPGGGVNSGNDSGGDEPELPW